MKISEEKNIVIDESPNHIAIIMDGNARWAENRGVPIGSGHIAGAKKAEKITEIAMEMGVKFLTLYAFSTENWLRPRCEVEHLLSLLRQYLTQSEKLISRGVRLRVIGDFSSLDQDTICIIKQVEELSSANDNMTLVIAFSYGGRAEITNAVKKIAKLIHCNSIKLEDVNDALLSSNLYGNDIPDPDLLIRTGGEFRVSNFLLWQIAYTELYFSNKLWPSFSRSDLVNAVKIFNQRRRRYGKR